MEVQFLTFIFLFILFQGLKIQNPRLYHLTVLSPLCLSGGLEVSFEFYLNSVSGAYQFLFGVAGTAGDEDVAFGQPVIFIYGDKLPIWFALNGHGAGRDDAGDYWAGDTLDLWKHPYGGSVTIDVNKWHQLTVASVKEDGKV